MRLAPLPLQAAILGLYDGAQLGTVLAEHVRHVVFQHLKYLQLGMVVHTCSPAT